MKTIKVCFLSWHFKSPKLFLDSLIKMTPNKSGKWENIEAVLEPNQADFCAIFDGYSGNFPKERAIYFGQHPYVEGLSPSFRNFTSTSCLLSLPLTKFFNCGEWWISYDYDYLSDLKPITKSKKACCIATYQTHNKMYNQRVIFLEELAKICNDIDLYGRPKEKYIENQKLKSIYRDVLGANNPDGTIGEHMVGKESIKDYKYTFEIDVGPTKNYISERFYDSLLLWCMPLYFGSNNVETIIPKDSFHYIDLYNLNDTKKIVDIINSDNREQNLKAIEEARYLLLNKYQTFAYVCDVVNNLDKYRRGNEK